MWHRHPDLYMNKLPEVLNTTDDSDFGHFVEVDLRYLNIIKEKTKVFQFCPESKIFPKDKYNDYLKHIKPRNYIKAKKLICDGTDKKNYLTHCNMINFYVTHGMVVDKIHEIISFKQSKWLEKNKNFNTEIQNTAKTRFEKDFYVLLINAFYGKTMESVRNRMSLEFI